MVRNRGNVAPYMTKDRSTVWELYHPGSSGARGVSVAEAYVGKGKETAPHVHARSQEIYYFLEGSGEMRLGERRLAVEAGDAVLIPPGTPHCLKAVTAGLRLLCISTPPYTHEDTNVL